MQKYFLKLQKAGLPIPGRLPPSRNTYRYFTHSIKRKSAMARQPTLASSRKSTFFASIVPSVKMEESDSVDYFDTSSIRAANSCRTEDNEGVSEDQCSSRLDRMLPSEDENWSEEAMDSEEFRLLKLLKMVKAEKGIINLPAAQITILRGHLFMMLHFLF